MKKIKEIIIVSLVSLVLILGLTLIYVLSNKYEDVDIISIKREYNIVFNNAQDTIDIPLYIGKRNTFLSKYSEVESTSISNSNYTLKSFLETIEIGSEINYNDKKYYEFIYHLSFKSYDDFIEPVFISDCLFNISYKNGEKMSYRIGNLSLFFNTKNKETNRDLIITKLSAVTNLISGKETIVGLNLSIYNNASKNITINKIKVMNKYYELDYLNLRRGLIDDKTNLKDAYENYSYTDVAISDGEMNLSLDDSNTISLFIPLKYTNGVKYVDRLPLYISYTIDTVDKMYVQDDFLFMMNTNPILYSNGLERYVYRYY